MIVKICDNREDLNCTFAFRFFRFRSSDGDGGRLNGSNC